MADRIHSYPMFPQNLAPNALQQPQMPQQQPQSQQPDPQMIPALSNPEHARMWQLQNPLQNPYRPQPSADLSAQQLNHQMQEFARGQALSHGQGQPIVQQLQQSFGLNAQRMNPQAPVFHDPQTSQPQSLIPSNFANMPMNTQQQLKVQFGMNPMMHAAMNNPVLSRQLKMLNPQDVAARLQQSGLGAQHAPNQPSAVDMFASQSMQPSQDQMRGSPHPAAQAVGPAGAKPAMIAGNQQANLQKRMLTPAEFRERQIYLASLINQSEMNIQNILQQATRNGTPMDSQFQQNISQMRTDLASRKEVYTKFMATFGAMMTQQMANGIPPANMPPMMARPAQPQVQQQANVSNAQVQPGFVTQVNQTVAAQYGMPAGNVPSPVPKPNQAALSQLQQEQQQQQQQQQQPQQQQMLRQTTIPPRTAGTPQQIPAQAAIARGSANFAPQGEQNVLNQMRPQPDVMPLDKARFETTYSQFCRSQNMTNGIRVTIGDNRIVDLHRLHSAVMHEGGGKSVTNREMWPVIGGKLDFIQFPGEPPRCGPGIAQQLQNTYEQLLQHFEDAYVVTVRSRNMGSPQQQPHSMSASPLPIVNNPTPNVSGNPVDGSRNPPNRANPQFISVAAQYAHTSAQDMRTQRVPDHVITFVERYRGELAKVQQQQQMQLLKRNAEQEQQAMSNLAGSLANGHEQVSIALQPGLQRPPPTMPSVDVKPVVNGSFAADSASAGIKQPPTSEQMQQAMMAIAQLKHVFQQRRLPGMTTQPIPEEHRLEYEQLLPQVHKLTSELDKRLHLYLVLFKNEELVRKYVAIVMTVARQRQLMTVTPPQYIINLATLRTMYGQILKLSEDFENRWRSLIKPPTGATATSSQNQVPLVPPPARPTPPTTLPPQNITSTQSNGRPALINHSPPPQLPQPPLHPQPPLQPPVPHRQTNLAPPSQPQIKKPTSVPPSPVPPVPATLANSATPPAASSSSAPATSAPTPQTVAGSPQTPKSPPTKTARSKPPRPTRKLSTAGKGSATPEMAPSVAGVKRPPEEDIAALASVGPLEPEPSNAPSPKKVKTEWEGELSEALVKKQQEVDNIKTDEDAAVFFDRMKELLAMTEPADHDIHHGIASTLDQILAGVAQEPADAAATAAALSAHGAGDAGPPPTALSPHLGPANDAFLEFIDFSSFTTLEDEDDSKAPTPDLEPSSETNPSPESGSEGDLLGATGSPDKTKIEESGDRSDPLRLGSLREIDGGESAYFQNDAWKWDGAMPVFDHPWAMSHS